MSEDKIIHLRNRLFFQGNLATFGKLFEKSVAADTEGIFMTARDLIRYVDAIIEDDDTCFLMWQRDGEIRGYMLATFETRPSTKTREVAMWQTIAGDSTEQVKKDIVKALETWAKEKGASVIRFNTTHVKAMKRIMGKYGFKPTITIFEKECG